MFVPVAAAADWLEWGGTTVFACSALAIVPLAGLMGRATESLAARLGAGVGGLLNATFGNAAELIIALAALQKGLQDVVKASLTGSIIGNVLLVLGLAIPRGRDRPRAPALDRAAAAVGSTLRRSPRSLVAPAVFHVVLERAVERDRLTRRGAPRARALVRNRDRAVRDLLHLLFALRTHKHLYTGQQHIEGATSHSATRPGVAIGQLLVAAVLVAWMSELLVGAVEEASHTLGLTEVFVGVIVVAIIGNAAEHSTAVLVARKDQMDLAMSIAIGSSIQIALLVAPVLVLVSYVVGPAPMDLRFTVFEVVSVGIAVFVVNLVAQDGESNWLEGALLLAVYAILGLAFYSLP